jgi:hypothetical protein
MLAPPGGVFVVSQAPIVPAHGQDESPVFVEVIETPGFVAMEQSPEVAALGCASACPCLA